VSSPQADVGELKSKAAVFAQLSSEESARHRETAKKHFPSGWFGSFSEAESTFTDEGQDAKPSDPFYGVMYGRDPVLTHSDDNTVDFNFLHESRSGGPWMPGDSWQTHPSVPNNIVGNEGKENNWRYTPAGWVQDYAPTYDVNSPKLLTAVRGAAWFDNEVNQVDGFGRERTPGVEAARLLLGTEEGWEERSVNTTLKCSDPGCMARSTIQLYNAVNETAKFCKLSISVHPTDFDDEMSLEHIEYWKVQDYIANRACAPKARGCNATADRPLYACLNAFDIDTIVNRSAGNVVVEGKISDMVDECPHEGNLLSSVLMATCLVRNKVLFVDTTTTTTTLTFNLNNISDSKFISCSTPGCIAEATLSVSPILALNGGKCTMTINVTLTDFENSTEKIDYIEINSKKVVTQSNSSAQPGKNPCNEAYAGTPLTAEESVFTSVKDYDVTDLVLNTYPHGEINVKSKITDMVDECPHEGNLLHALAHVICVGPDHFSATPPPYSSVFMHQQDIS
jgi:hypothetical protein